MKVKNVEFKEQESEGCYKANVVITMDDGLEIHRSIEVEEQAPGSNFVKQEKQNAIAGMIKSLLEQVVLM